VTSTLASSVQRPRRNVAARARSFGTSTFWIREPCVRRRKPVRLLWELPLEVGAFRRGVVEDDVQLNVVLEECFQGAEDLGEAAGGVGDRGDDFCPVRSR
jgi:hypothetical protein